MIVSGVVGLCFRLVRHRVAICSCCFFRVDVCCDGFLMVIVLYFVVSCKTLIQK